MFDPYDLFGKSVPGGLLAFGLLSLLPAEIFSGGGGERGLPTLASLAVGVVGVLLVRLVVGQGVNTLADDTTQKRTTARRSSEPSSNPTRTGATPNESPKHSTQSIAATMSSYARTFTTENERMRTDSPTKLTLSISRSLPQTSSSGSTRRRSRRRTKNWQSGVRSRGSTARPSTTSRWTSRSTPRR